MITGKTKVFAILADPVGHVRTPQAMNDLFTTHDHDAVMVPFEVAPDMLEQAVQGIRATRNFGGFVVTVPHKTQVGQYCDVLSDRAMASSAVNVVRRDNQGRLCGDILDGEGFVAGLKIAGTDLQSKSVFLAGAGGAASAIAFAIAARGIARLTIANRSRDKAEALIKRLAAAYPDVVFRAGGDPAAHDIAVNGTSLGLGPDDPLPFDPAQLSSGTLVADVIMQPEVTGLLAAAAARGLTIHTGKKMLEGQVSAILSFLTSEENEE